MAGLKNHAGFNLTTNKLQFVEISFNDEGFALENIDEIFYNEPLNFYSDKKTKILTNLHAAFDELCIKKEMTAELVSFTYPTSLFKITQLPVEKSLHYHDLLEELRWEYSVLYPDINTSEYVFSSCEVKSNVIKTADTEIITAIPRKFLSIANDFAEKNGLKIRHVDNSHFAADNAIELSGERTAGITLSMYFADNYFSAELLSEGNPVYFRTAKLKNAGEIIKALELILFPSGKPIVKKDEISRAFISGENVSESLTDSLSNFLETPVIPLNPFSEIPRGENFTAENLTNGNTASFAPAAGIAARLS